MNATRKSSMKISPDYVFKKFVELLVEQSGYTEDVLKLTPETQLLKLQADGYVDSLDMIELVMAVEDEFRIEIPDEQVESVKTVGAYVELAVRLINKRDELEARFAERTPAQKLEAQRANKSPVLWTVELTHRQFEKLQAKGGEAWLKKTLNR